VERSNPVCGAALDCFVANAPRNDERAQTRCESESVCLWRLPDAMQRVSGASQIRDRQTLGVCEGPGSAAHHYMLRCARDTWT